VRPVGTAVAEARPGVTELTRGSVGVASPAGFPVDLPVGFAGGFGARRRGVAGLAAPAAPLFSVALSSPPGAPAPVVPAPLPSWSSTEIRPSRCPLRRSCGSQHPDACSVPGFRRRPGRSAGVRRRPRGSREYCHRRRTEDRGRARAGIGARAAARSGTGTGGGADANRSWNRRRRRAEGTCPAGPGPYRPTDPAQARSRFASHPRPAGPRELTLTESAPRHPPHRLAVGAQSGKSTGACASPPILPRPTRSGAV
jgi:hypothetical protein